ncbi:MAG: hypothetical protein K2K00_03350 [Muribaculaceae bacterium]|nr:hypothetical protein [Muribaculaceae bacterium]
MKLNKTSKNYISIFSILALILIVAFAIGKWNNIQWLSELVELCGILISLAGVVIAIVQVSQVAEITAATNKAVKENRREIKNFLSFSDMAHLTEQIKNAQNYIRTNDYHPAIVLIQTIKDNLIKATPEFNNLISSIDIPEIITNISIDIRNLVEHNIYVKQDSPRQNELNPAEIHEHLEIAREAVVKIESQLKQNKI